MPSSEREHTGLSLSEADALFRVGEFAELVRRATSRSQFRVSMEPEMCIRIAHALVLIGDWTQARGFIPTAIDHMSPALRSRVSLVHGLVAHAVGALSIAAQHFRAAIRLANLKTC